MACFDKSIGHRRHPSSTIDEIREQLYSWRPLLQLRFSTVSTEYAASVVELFVAIIDVKNRKNTYVFQNIFLVLASFFCCHRHMQVYIIMYYQMYALKNDIKPSIIRLGHAHIVHDEVDGEGEINREKPRKSTYITATHRCPNRHQLRTRTS